MLFALTACALDYLLPPKLDETESCEKAAAAPPPWGDQTALQKQDLFRARKRVTSAAQSVSYANTDPLLIVEGVKQYLIDESGVKYLDTRNNVAHVGHCHPSVVKAVSLQVSQVNTNTRYLHPHHIKLAQRLLSTMPEPLSSGVVFFVNSGSEANDLALRIARHCTQATNTIVVENAYHGHTIEVIGISPYKYSHPTIGKPHTTTEVHAPNVFRGIHKGEDAAERYADEVKDACDTIGCGNLSAFIVESGMSVAGVILPPSGYLASCFKTVRDAGGVCICDEVQTGLGRTGHWWCFEQQNVVPDIVTCGKPFGNGMPLAAVICRRELADAFSKGPEYFNTFGGNPVCCAAGLSVLDVIIEEGLIEHAQVTGKYLIDKIKLLSSSRAGHLIGDVRGSGLFVGIEFVRGPSLEPATAETSWLCSRLKDRHRILTSIDGPLNNVVVIKPPLIFNRDDVDCLVSAMAAELVELAQVDLSQVSHTPT